ncbi:glycosyltransferase [Vibrio cholerae]|uniref:glycosyltransferase n=1 Tax=Vibrio cholerae TaxID=666 RepID=UPI001C2FCE4E|nr:glycosyltransferase [Vibrio cholerae]EGR4192200.1 glycosyltransferase [Vibrio cholerae]
MKVKIGIVVFNWNYGVYLGELLNNMKDIINSDEYKIIVCDDGSYDNSLAVLDNYINENNAKNIIICSKNEINKGREKPYLGQLENLKNAYDSRLLDDCQYIWLMDADDYLLSRDLPKDFYNYYLSGSQVSFTKVINFTKDKQYGLIIKRKANEILNIWPTVSVTSSIIMSRDFLAENYSRLFNFDTEFDDVWLDSRVNMIASRINNDLVRYINFPIYRRIHGGNDSGKMSLRRRILKQNSSNRYYSYICNYKKPFNLRTKLLDVFFKS